MVLVSLEILHQLPGTGQPLLGHPDTPNPSDVSMKNNSEMGWFPRDHSAHHGGCNPPHSLPISSTVLAPLGALFCQTETQTPGNTPGTPCFNL